MTVQISKHNVLCIYAIRIETVVHNSIVSLARKGVKSKFGVT